MRKLRGLQAQLVHYLSSPHVWHSKGALTADREWKHSKGRQFGKRYLPETVGRALRLLEEDKFIAVKDDGLSVQYKWIPADMRLKYIPYSKRPAWARQTLFNK